MTRVGTIEVLQAYNAECDNKGRMEDVRNSKRKAEENAQHSGPVRKSVFCVRHRPILDLG